MSHNGCCMRSDRHRQIFISFTICYNNIIRQFFHLALMSKMSRFTGEHKIPNITEILHNNAWPLLSRIIESKNSAIKFVLAADFFGVAQWTICVILYVIKYLLFSTLYNYFIVSFACLYG